MPRSTPLFCLVTLASLHAQSTQAQQRTTLTGLITDPTGAVIPGATIVLHPRLEGPAVTTTSGPTGSYTLTIPTGTSGTLDVTAPGFAPYLNPSLQLPAGRTRTLNVQLIIATQTEQVEVSGATTDTTDPNNNGDAITLKGSDLALLPTNQTELLQQLQAISGGNSPDLFVDGFSGGTLPPKDSIREIRINQNPYSALNDTNPVNGRIEVFTKPGSEKLHGSFYLSGEDSALNSQNPFVPVLPPYYSYFSFGNLSGPINKHSSYFLTFNRRSSQGSSIIDAQTLDANLNQIAFNQVAPSPNTALGFFARYDAALGKKSTFIASYGVNQNTQTNSGIGQLTLATAGINTFSVVQTVQLSNTQIFSPKIVNDTRFQYVRSRTHQDPTSNAPAIIVEGAFNGGGSASGSSRDNLDRYELQNYWNASEGKHYLSFGARLRVARDANESLGNYNGTYIFAPPTSNSAASTVTALTIYQKTLQLLAAGQTPAQIRAAGYGASQLTLTAGNPAIAVALADIGTYLQDDFKLKPNLTVSGGLRFESQTGIHDHADFAPRAGINYGLFAKKNKPAPYTLRGGAGIFYYRFSYGNLEQAARQNGITQQQYVIQSPDFYPVVPAPATLAAQAPSSVVQISPTFHAPYYIATTLAVDRRIGSLGTVSASYVTNRGVHTQLQRNVNAPLPGTYSPEIPNSGTRPLGGTEDVFQYQSEGIFNAKRMNVNFNLHARKFFVSSFYQLLSQHSDTDGGFPSNQYNLGADYGRASNDIRQNFGFSGSVPLPFGFSTYMFLHAASGNPFNITLGQDLNGDSQFNDRPTFATDLTRPSVVQTRYGAFDTAPIAGQTTIPRNYGQSPGFFGTYLSLDRSFQFGPELKPPAGATPPKLAPGAKPPRPDRRYNLHLSIDAENVTNHVSLNTPVGVLNSPLFGKSTALANGNNSGNREIELQTYFSF